MLPGTHFLVAERLDNLPDGYTYVRKIVTEDTYDGTTTSETYQNTAPDGKIRNNTTADVIVENQPAGHIVVEKQWDSGDFVTTHGDVYVALYKKNVSGDTVTYELVEDSARKLTIDQETGKYLVEYNLPKALVNDYVVREVNVSKDNEGNISVISFVDEGKYITVSRETTKQSENASDNYVVNYTQGEASDYNLSKEGAGGTDKKGVTRTDIVKNTLPKVSLYKTNEAAGGGKKYLKGAVFALENADGTPVTDASGSAVTFTSKTDGEVFKNRYFSEGTYYLHETHAPDGYILLKNRIKITVSAGNVTAIMESPGTTLYMDQLPNDVTSYKFEVMNNPGVALPSTGGPGTRLFTILGSFLILGAGVLLWRRRRFI